MNSDELKMIIEGKKITTLFQPVVSLQNGEIIGYEALSRGFLGNSLYSPDELFNTAKRENMVFELERICRINAIANFNVFDTDKLLFINVDPDILKDEHFIKGNTKDILKFFNANPSNVIFEVTEKTCVEDYKSFKKVIDNYKSQGYKIAIDDVGTGYSGLSMIAETRPYYIKIDITLIKNIDRDNLKRAIVKALVEFANTTGMKLIAEGIENVDELSTVIELGVHFGQGFLLKKPGESLSDIDNDIKDMIIKFNSLNEKLRFSTSAAISIGEIARRDVGVSPFVFGNVIEKIFMENQNIQGIPMVENGKTVGLIMRKKFFSHIGTQYGWAIYMKRPVYKIMDTDPLIVDYNTPINDVAKAVISRDEDKLYDYIIVNKNNNYYGVVPVITLLEKTMQLELNIAKYSNPLTGLPGNLIIEENLNKILKENKEFSLLYFDLNNFKAYNDVYGFENGDKVIKYTANIIERHLYFYNDSFLGHIGGDDFIAIVKTLDVEKLCKNIIQEFDHNIVRFYNDADIERGYICTLDRFDNETCFPIMGISISVVNSLNKNFNNIDEISEFASKIKKACKKFKKSHYIIE
ncbi:GGDEF domain-containing protein [Thermoanaerobacterium sp. RBIITD]|uniref:GGDEF domain-containing protein n=1 Tax=Thermoanaerobacterium sp. RBIITD TaxID=1550240 RepID=UPI000BB951CE|nr:GGDEF domain-containing protein [Thermoanaerobacterium sp. RBIITD]SNX53529.1 diguanylate cyclase (GGDEF) domain-containing protein [Thermoanaerobacterium sp. RBIITD]